MNINIVYNENKSIKKIIKEYEKRLTRYAKIKSINSKNYKRTDKTYYIGIRNGEYISSEELADKIKTYSISGKSNITFIFDKDFKCDEYINISSLDLSDDILIAILFEQIYRSFRIINNQAYHK